MNLRSSEKVAKTVIVPINEERSFEPQELFFSLTDRKGIIRYGNEVFTRISGYTEEELIGEPHNIIRHPDMPRAVFKLLWDYLEAGKSIAAYVKNLAKDGRYYWVLATVTPTPTGYLSIRLKPSSPLFDAVQSVYKKALELEKDIERETGNRKMAMQRSLEFIVEQLQASGFDNYDHFMSEALSQEITSREKWLRDMGYQTQQSTARAGDSGLVQLESSCDMLSGLLKSVFSSLDAFKRLGAELAGKYEMIQELAPSLQFLALNARMAASRLGDKGVVQAAVADALGGKSKQAEACISSLVERMSPLKAILEQQVYNIAVARFEAEVAHAFATELRQASAGSHAPLVIESLGEVVQELAERCRQVVEGMHSLGGETELTHRDVQSLIGFIVEMKAIQLNGKIEAAGGAGKNDFSVIFDEASRYIEVGRKDCDVLLDVLAASAEKIDDFEQFESQLSQGIASLQQSVGGGASRYSTESRLTAV